jgi:hypothetical protein
MFCLQSRQPLSKFIHPLKGQINRIILILFYSFNYKAKASRHLRMGNIWGCKLKPPCALWRLNFFQIRF